MPAALRLTKKHCKKDAQRVMAGLDEAINIIIDLYDESDYNETEEESGDEPLPSLIDDVTLVDDVVVPLVV